MPSVTMLSKTPRNPRPAPAGPPGTVPAGPAEAPRAAPTARPAPIPRLEKVVRVALELAAEVPARPSII